MSLNEEKTQQQDQANKAGADQHEASVPNTVRMGRWFVVLLILLFGVVAAGGTVRLTESGMSIPEWPIIYYGEGKTQPSVLPPFFNEEAWQVASDTYHHEYLIPNGKDAIAMPQFKREFMIEYFHRFIVSLFGIVYLAVLVQIFRNQHLRKKVGVIVSVASIVLFLQIVLGGKVVLNHTHPLYVSTHLIMAFTFISLIVWTTLRLFRNEADPLPETKPKALKWAWATVAIAVIQIFIGGIVAKTKAGKFYNTWPEMGETLVPPTSVLWNSEFANPLLNFLENLVLIQFVHRWWAFVVLAAVLYLVYRLFRMPLTAGGRFAVRGVVGVVFFQILLGIVTLLQAVPFSLGLLHLLTGLVLLEFLVMITYEVKTNHLIPEAEKELASRRSWEDDPEQELEKNTARVS